MCPVVCLMNVRSRHINIWNFSLFVLLVCSDYCGANPTPNQLVNMPVDLHENVVICFRSRHDDL